MQLRIFLTSIKPGPKIKQEDDFGMEVVSSAKTISRRHESHNQDLKKNTDFENDSGRHGKLRKFPVSPMF